MNKQNNQKKLPTQMMLMIRGFLALYLLYLASDILKTEDYTNPRMIVIICAVIFIVAGVVLLIDLIRIFIKGEYEGGKADVSEDIAIEEMDTTDSETDSEIEETGNSES